MSIEDTKRHLMHLLESGESKVISLHGNWGTGKSYLWKKVQEQSNLSIVKDCIYVSFFGISDLNEIKSKLVYAGISKSHKSTNLNDFISFASKGLQGLNRGFGALSDVAVVAAPYRLKGKLIVLDDIERKSEKLPSEAILGFVDEFTQQHDCRFVLIFNDDEIKDKEIWRGLREKVIDQELYLVTTPGESFKIATCDVKCVYEDYVEFAIKICNIKNIRIIRKVVKIVNNLLSGYADLPDATLWQIIPSTVVLSAIHLNGIPKGPTLEFLISTFSGHSYLIPGMLDQESKETDPDEIRWKNMIADLRISSFDDFDLLLIDQLKVGMHDYSGLHFQIENYIKKNENLKAQALYYDFIQKFTWDHFMSRSDLLSEANAISKYSHLVDISFVSLFHELVSTLDGGEAVANQVLNDAIERVRNWLPSDYDASRYSANIIHPALRAEINDLQSKYNSSMQPLDAVLKIDANSSWGTREEISLRSATVSDFNYIISTCSIENLKPFMRRMIDWSSQRENYVVHFGSATDNFIEACKILISNEPNSRLSQVVKFAFDEVKQSTLLD